jgi:hypothetical protein
MPALPARKEGNEVFKPTEAARRFGQRGLADGGCGGSRPIRRWKVEARRPEVGK